MKNDQILSQITEFCRQADMAETTFGRRVVNDGKLVHRLREGKRITVDTLDRIQAYIAASTGALYGCPSTVPCERIIKSSASSVSDEVTRRDAARNATNLALFCDLGSPP